VEECAPLPAAVAAVAGLTDTPFTFTATLPMAGVVACHPGRPIAIVPFQLQITVPSGFRDIGYEYNSVVSRTKLLPVEVKRERCIKGLPDSPF
jgi:hypothetical protein